MSYQSGYDLDACIIKCEKYKRQRDKLLEMVKAVITANYNGGYTYQRVESWKRIIEEIENEN